MKCVLEKEFISIMKMVCVAVKIIQTGFFFLLSCVA